MRRSDDLTLILNNWRIGFKCSDLGPAHNMGKRISLTDRWNLKLVWENTFIIVFEMCWNY
jgi:hypothetical protein